MEMISLTGNDTAGDAKEFRQPPHNIEAEQALLGALLINNEGLTHIGDFLRHEHFYEPVHQRIFEAITKFHDRGLIANPITLKNYFAADPALAEAGGAAYLVRLAAGTSAIISVKDYAHTIYELALKRKLIDIGEHVVNDAYDEHIDKTATDMIEGAEQQLFTLAMEGSSESRYEHVSKAVTAAIHHTETAFKNAGQVSGLTTGLRDLDKLMGGLQKSDLVIIAGRPSMGKTALAVNIAYNAAKTFRTQNPDNKEPGSVAVFSLEMSSEQLASRLLSSEARINAAALRRGEITEEQFSKLVLASRQLASTPLYIDDTPAISISALRTRARRMKRQHNLSLIVVDYLQLMRSTSEHAKTNRVMEISDITMGLKAIAKELNIPVIALSQLSRAVEQRDDKRPQLSDLRESGSIEQDADVVMFVYREEYYLARKMPREDTPEFYKWQEECTKVAGKAEVIIAKQRHGPIGTVGLNFQSQFAYFSDPAEGRDLDFG